MILLPVDSFGTAVLHSLKNKPDPEDNMNSLFRSSAQKMLKDQHQKKAGNGGKGGLFFKTVGMGFRNHFVTDDI